MIKDLCKNNLIPRIRHVDVSWKDLDEQQCFENIKITAQFPISEISFKKKDFLLGMVISYIKTNWNDISPDEFECFLNEIKIDKIDLSKINEYSSLAKDENNVLVVTEKKSSYWVFRQGLIEKKEEDNI